VECEPGSAAPLFPAITKGIVPLWLAVAEPMVRLVMGIAMPTLVRSGSAHIFRKRIAGRVRLDHHRAFVLLVRS